MVEGGSGQDDGVVVGPLRGVAPGALQGVPEVAPGRVAHDPLGETPPNQEGKVHLQAQTWNTRVVVATFSEVLVLCLCVRSADTYLTGQQDRVLVQTQHRLCLYGNVR